MRFLKSGFFHQTTPPGPIRDMYMYICICIYVYVYIYIYVYMYRDLLCTFLKDSPVSGTPGVTREIIKLGKF